MNPSQLALGATHRPSRASRAMSRAADAPPMDENPSSAPPRSIKRIDDVVVHRICSGQVVLSLASCVKELVENALDAGATNVEIRLKDHGADVVEVSDNGSGVPKASFEALTTKYATSKLKAFEDLETLRTFGFRGEALSSLCGISGEFSVTTRTADDASGTKIVYDAKGAIVSESVVPRSVGTTATVCRLFEPLAVRRKEFLRNVKREYGRALHVVQAYALMSKSVRILCTHQSGKYGRTNVLHTRGGEEASVRENVVTVFGAKMVAAMQEIDFDLSDADGDGSSSLTCRIVGYVSKAQNGCGRAGTDRQFYYVNGRPVDLPRVAKVLNETYRSFNPNQAPMAVLDVQLPTDSYDVNVTPDKRKVMLHQEQELLTKMKEKLTEAFAPSRYTYTVSQAPLSNTKKRPSLSTSFEGDDGDDVMEDEHDDEELTPTECMDEETFETLLLTAKEPAANDTRGRGKKRDASSAQKGLQNFGFTRETTAVAIGGGWTMATADDAGGETEMRDAPAIVAFEEDVVKKPKVGDSQSDDTRTKEPDTEDERANVGHEQVTFDDVVVAAVVEEPRGPDSTREDSSGGALAFSMETMRARRRNVRSEVVTTVDEASKSKSEIAFAAARIPAVDGETEPSHATHAAAASELERVFNKADFAKMRIVGQFNLGFILAVLGDDLFIVDQHASDEIYNFERLQRTSTLTRQPLIHPVPLDLTASEEQTVLQNMPVFLQNGFGFCDVAETVPGADMNNSSIDPTARCGALRLNAVPFLKNVAFDKSDVQELVSMLDQGQHSLPSKSQLSIGLAREDAAAARSRRDASPRVLRPSKTRAALAMKACRSSIMIGDALDARSMRRVLRNLGALDAPWNCPHGRPTMRHVRCLRSRRAANDAR